MRAYDLPPPKFRWAPFSSRRSTSGCDGVVEMIKVTNGVRYDWIFMK